MERSRSLRGLKRENEPGTQLNLLVPVSKHRALKRYAAGRGMSMSAVVCEWIDKHAGGGDDSR